MKEENKELIRQLIIQTNLCLKYFSEYIVSGSHIKQKMILFPPLTRQLLILISIRWKRKYNDSIIYVIFLAN